MTTVNQVHNDGCDLCGNQGTFLLAGVADMHNRTVVCTRCRLIYSAPQPTVEFLEQHYRAEFLGDPGSQQSLLLRPEMPEVAKEEKLASQWSIKLVKQHVNLEGKHVLDLRCRTGALSARMEQFGAVVTPVDPFSGNIEYAKTQRGLSQALCWPMTKFHGLPFQDESFDLITALTEHVPGHVICASALFADLLRLLKPGGLLLLDEKDVLRPKRFKVPTIIDTGPAHLYHFTQHTLQLYLRRAGFGVRQCAVDRTRSSASRHLCVVAEKPRSVADRGAPLSWSEGPSIAAIRRQVWWSRQRWRMRNFRKSLSRRASRRAA